MDKSFSKEPLALLNIIKSQGLDLELVLSWFEEGWQNMVAEFSDYSSAQRSHAWTFCPHRNKVDREESLQIQATVNALKANKLIYNPYIDNLGKRNYEWDVTRIYESR